MWLVPKVPLHMYFILNTYLEPNSYSYRTIDRIGTYFTLQHGTNSMTSLLQTVTFVTMNEGLDGGSCYSLITKNLAIYTEKKL